MLIPVTKPFLPPKHEYDAFLKGIWEREYLTNNGPLVQELEQKLREYLNVPNMLYLSNGTIALQIAIKALGLKGEIITTPFSYVATTSSIVWEGCSPVFVDIDPHTLNIDPNLIESAITEQTTGILATHVFGNPCDIDAIQAIADKHRLKVIYDAAHCFGSTYKGKSVFAYGDVSTTSFHATKLFHTIEGGAVFSNNTDIHYRMGKMRNFGHDGPEHFNGVGINGKNSEFHAAMGLVNFKYIDNLIKKRKEQFIVYKELFYDRGIRLQKKQVDAETNGSYFAIIMDHEEQLMIVKNRLEKNDIFPRRYFYPCLNHLEYVISKNLPHVEHVASSILCLPMYFDLTREKQEQIVKIILDALRNNE